VGRGALRAPALTFLSVLCNNNNKPFFFTFLSPFSRLSRTLRDDTMCTMCVCSCLSAIIHCVPVCVLCACVVRVGACVQHTHITITHITRLPLPSMAIYITLYIWPWQRCVLALFYYIY
jgi:hypothetical protein